MDYQDGLPPPTGLGFHWTTQTDWPGLFSSGVIGRFGA